MPGHMYLGEPPILSEPSREPQDHANHTERRDRSIDRTQPSAGMELVERATHQIEIHPHPVFDLLAPRRRQRADFVLQMRDGALATRRDARVSTDELAKPLSRVA